MMMGCSDLAYLPSSILCLPAHKTELRCVNQVPFGFASPPAWGECREKTLPPKPNSHTVLCLCKLASRQRTQKRFDTLV